MTRRMRVFRVGILLSVLGALAVLPIRSVR
jgi:hypothetical protein